MDDFTLVVLVATGVGCAAFLVWDLWWRDEDMEPEDSAVVGPFGPVPPPVGFHHSRVVNGTRQWPWDDDGPEIADVAMGVAAALDFNDNPEPSGLSDYEPPAAPSAVDEPGIDRSVWTHHETGGAGESSASDYGSSSDSSSSCDSSDSGSSSSDSGSSSGGE